MRQYQKNPSKRRAGRVAQGIGSEFRLQYWKQKGFDGK
jgi:hypothetical protein